MSKYDDIVQMGAEMYLMDCEKQIKYGKELCCNKSSLALSVEKRKRAKEFIQLIKEGRVEIVINDIKPKK